MLIILLLLVNVLGGEVHYIPLDHYEICKPLNRYNHIPLAYSDKILIDYYITYIFYVMPTGSRSYINA